MVRRAALVCMASGLALALGGCVVITPTKEQVTTIPVSHVSGTPIKVSAHNGHISVKKANRTDVEIVATLRMATDERLAQTTIAANRDSTGALVVTATPPGNAWNSNEGCAFDISLPGAMGVTLSTSNGRLELEGVSGAADLKTSNGRIIVMGHDGGVTARSSNGRIEAMDVTGPVDCDTSNGAVKVRLTSSGSGPVKIDTSNGAITLEVGRGFTGEIDASTSNGSIHTPPIGGNVDVNWHSRARKARVSLGKGGAPCTLDTSNGSVTIKYVD